MFVRRCTPPVVLGAALVTLAIGATTARPSLPPHGGSAAGPQRPGVARPGEERSYPIAPGLKMVFCYIPPGKATLGSPPSEPERGPDEDEHEYTSKGFWLGKYEVTQAEWKAVMGNNPSEFSATGPRADRVQGMDTSRFPVEAVSWDDSEEFVKKLNGRGGAEKAFGRPGKFCIPHEDEWEYACRGGKGNKSPFYFGKELNGTQANCDGNNPYGTTAKGPYLGRTTTVGSYEKDYPHPWGLCDVHGNVCEWCEAGKPGGPPILYRDSSWISNAGWCRAARRGPDPVTRTTRMAFFGLRLCFRPG